VKHVSIDIRVLVVLEPLFSLLLPLISQLNYPQLILLLLLLSLLEHLLLQLKPLLEVHILLPHPLFHLTVEPRLLPLDPVLLFLLEPLNHFSLLLLQILRLGELFALKL